MRSSTPHLMLALCTMAVQAAPISPAPKTPDMLTVMSHGEVEARDTLDTNNLDVNDYRRRSTSGFPGPNHEMEAPQTNVKRSIGGYSYPAGSNAVSKRDEAQSNAPAASNIGVMNDSDADSGFNSNSDSGSDSAFDSDSDDGNLGPRDIESFAHMEVRDAPASPLFQEDKGLDDMFQADADDEFDDFEDNGNFDNLDFAAQHAEIKRSIDEFLQDYAVEKRGKTPAAAQEDSQKAQSFDSDSDSDSSFDSDTDSASDSDDKFGEKALKPASTISKPVRVSEVRETKGADVAESGKNVMSASVMPPSAE